MRSPRWIAYKGYPDEVIICQRGSPLVRRLSVWQRRGSHNPWSLSQLHKLRYCLPTYRGNTSGNAVAVGDLMRGADESTTEEIYKLPGAAVRCVWAPPTSGHRVPRDGALLQGRCPVEHAVPSGYSHDGSNRCLAQRHVVSAPFCDSELLRSPGRVPCRDCRAILACRGAALA